MARHTEKKKQSLAVLAGLIVFVLGAGLANADVRGEMVYAIVEAEEPGPAPVAPEGDDAAAGQSPVVGALEADHAAPAEEAKLEEEAEDVDEEPDDPDPDADPADDQTTVGAVPPPASAPDDDTDTDDGKTSIPLPEVDDDTDEADDAGTADDEDEQTQDGDESADEDD